MHCAANIGNNGDTALFFGLSGTGKTTLSADPERRLIGDDEHGWSAHSVFNFEGGCYAKCCGLSREYEPQIFSAIQYGALLENVNFLPGTRMVNYNDTRKTENTRAAYPLSCVSSAVTPSLGAAPKNIFFLTADAFGVLPPISRLTAEQAMYHFLSGYTAKVAGTETGITTPGVTFSACFGEAFLPLNPLAYATLLGEKLKRQRVNIWLVNTGWTGGGYGAGHRVSLTFTRAMIRAALNGSLDHVNYVPHPVFRLQVPSSCPAIPDSLIDPRNTWTDKDAYDESAGKLAAEFQRNFQKYLTAETKHLLSAGPIALQAV